MKTSLTFLIVIFIFISTASPPFVHADNTQTLYPLTFIEIGLPIGHEWTFYINNRNVTTAGNITLYEPNGTYNIKISPINGFRTYRYEFSINVSGIGCTQYIYWYNVKYDVNFYEYGLKSGTQWGINFNGTEFSTSNYSITLEMPNGTYNYSINPVSGYNSSIDSGTMDVDGGSVSVSIFFNVIMNITFFMSGLNNGQLWSVTINGKAYYSTSPFLYVNIDNGSYKYYVHVPSNYYASPSQGTVNGDNNFVFINAYSYLPWEILIVIIVLVDIVLLIFINRRRHSGKE